MATPFLHRSLWEFALWNCCLDCLVYIKYHLIQGISYEPHVNGMILCFYQKDYSGNETSD